MDLKFKGKIWVGNIYHKFEAICQEVDDLVSQDTVKYVENQVQTAGDSVKRFCSDVVQDLLPFSLMEAGKCKAQAVSLKQNDTIGSCIRSMVVIEEKPVCAESTNLNQSLADLCQIDPLKNGCEQFFNPPSADCVKEAETDLSLGPEVDALKCKKMDNVFEENETNGLVDKKWGIAVEEIGTKEELLDMPDTAVGENDTKEEPYRLEEPELFCPENSDLSEESLLGESTEEKAAVLAEVSLATSVCHTQKEKIGCISFLDEVQRVSDISTMLPSSEMDLLVISGENKTAKVGLTSSSSSLSTEMSGFSHDDATNHGEDVRYNPVGAIGSVSNLSGALLPSQSFPILCCDNNVSDTRLTLSSRSLSLESNDSSTDDAATLVGSYESRHEYCYEFTQLEALVSSMEIGEADDCRVDIADPSMETIELSDKVKLDEGCVVVDNKLLYPVSCRAQRHRSYKKILQDAFASKKRIRKEYEQLAILYGDIDIESSQQAGQKLLLPSLDSKKSPSQDLCDLEWELL